MSEIVLSNICIARVAHEANREFCEALGDHSQKSWNEAEIWQRESAVAGVQFRLSHPDALPGAQHEAWLQDKVDAGWKYGPVKDAAKKEHPCLVAFGDLPLEQQAKDALFIGIVDALKCLLPKTT